jgi:hypothetical protein
VRVAVLLAVLALFDALLAGFRAAAGRDGRIDKRHYFRIAIGRSAVGAVVLIAINIGVVALLVVTATDVDATWAQLVRAGEICVWVFGAFATLTLAAMAFWFSPVPEYRLLSSIIVLGPLTLFRPLVIAGGLALAGAWVNEPRVWIAAAFAGVTMLAFEHVIGRGHAQRWRGLVG